MKKRRIISSYYNYFYKEKLPLIKDICRRMAKTPNQYNLYFSIGIVELMYCMITLDTNIASLNTHIYNRVSGKIRHLIRKENLLKNKTCSLEKCSTKGFCDNKNKIFVEEIFNLLDNEEKLILRMYYMNNNTLQEIADKINMSASNIYILKNKAIDKVRKKLGVIINNTVI